MPTTILSSSPQLPVSPNLKSLNHFTSLALVNLRPPQEYSRQPLSAFNHSPALDQLSPSLLKQFPRFCGDIATQKLRQGRALKEPGYYATLSAEEAEEAITTDTTPYVGAIPATLLNCTGLTGDQMFSDLGDLADKLRTSKTFKAKDAIKVSSDVKLGNATFKVKLISEGSYNKVYSLIEKNGGLSFALRVHQGNVPADKSEHSPYKEAANGLFLAARNIHKDCIRFYAANPSRGCSLVELIPPTAKVSERDGYTIDSSGLWFIDDKPSNRVGDKSEPAAVPETPTGINCDLGGFLAGRTNLPVVS